MAVSSVVQKIRPTNTILFLWCLALIFNIIAFLLLYYKIHPGKATLALRYNILVGVDLYGKGYNLYLIPGIGFLILAINYTLYRTLRWSKTFLIFLSAFVSVSVEAVLLLAVLFLTKVN